MQPPPSLCPWLHSSLGTAILNAEQLRLRAPLGAERGTRLAQLGCVGRNLMTASSMPHHLQIKTDAGMEPAFDLYSAAAALPLEQESLDALLLHHTLETVNDPHGVLREAERTLAGEGALYILGFNPHSYWALWRTVGIACPPRSVPLLGLHRLCDWLKLLDLTVESVETFFPLPPFSNQQLLSSLQLLKILDKVPLRALHALYLVRARKHRAPLTPTKVYWQARTPALVGGLAEPST